MRARLALSFVVPSFVVLACAGCPGVVPAVEGFQFSEALSRAGDVQVRTVNCFSTQNNSGFSISLGFPERGVNSTVLLDPAPAANVSVTGPDGGTQALTWNDVDFDEETAKRILIPLEDGTLYTFTGNGTRAAPPNTCF